MYGIARNYHTALVHLSTFVWDYSTLVVCWYVQFTGARRNIFRGWGGAPTLKKVEDFSARKRKKSTLFGANVESKCLRFCDVLD